jgi:hypothetical protein
MNDMAKCSPLQTLWIQAIPQGSWHQRRPGNEVEAPETEKGALFEGLGDGRDEEFKRSVYPNGTCFFSQKDS